MLENALTNISYFFSTSLFFYWNKQNTELALEKFKENFNSNHSYHIIYWFLISTAESVNCHNNNSKSPTTIYHLNGKRWKYGTFIQWKKVWVIFGNISDPVELSSKCQRACRAANILCRYELLWLLLTKRVDSFSIRTYFIKINNDLVPF